MDPKQQGRAVRMGEGNGAGSGDRLRSKRLSLAGWVLSALLGTLAMGFAGAAGCGDTIDSRGQSETAGQPEALGEAHQADSTPITCVTLQRGLTKAFDAMISSEKGDNNYGTGTVALVGQASGGVDHFYALFRFDTASIPVNATITSATLALSQVAAAPGTWNAHLIKAPWDEAFVTWNSFNSAFEPVPFKSPSTATASVVFNVAPQLQAWVSGAAPNHGILIAQPGASQSKIKTSEFVLANGRPFIAACYKVTCPPHFADCNGSAADGCEADLHSPATCGACGSPCVLPHATPSCATGVCAVGSCDLGWSDCDGNPANGCETSLTTATDCGACGVPCALPGAVTSCAAGSCKVLSCTAGHFDCDGDAQDGCEATPCGDGAHCAANAGCTSQVCVGGFCASPACNDHAKNGDESDLDCGGSCPPCADGQGCGAASDCQSAVCAAGACAAATCADATKNGAETDVDCGGACPPCADAQLCGLGSDCQSGVCQGGVCHAPACTDGLKNGSETGVDCGGGCAPCAAGTGCLVAGDCQSGVCSAAVCQIPSCADGVKNGSESDVDCGGSCAPCNDNAACTKTSDCTSGVCVGGHCQPPSCSDGVKNGDETGLDCGGACTIPEVCNGVDDDCNGSTDEGLGSTTCGIGACQVTVPNCAGGQVQSCVPGAAGAEICDGQLDDDCDGVVDNGCDCVNGATQGCYTGSLATQNVGTCHGGTQTCVLGHWGACAGELKPGAETCDGLDNDCDGQTDEDLGSTICGIGACQAMVQNCVAGVAQSCVPGQSSAEICDGIDNDCDGAVDEDQPLLNCGVGACAATAPSCVNGAPGVCDPHASDGVACNDGHDCTSNDSCSNGVCAGAKLAAGTLCRASTGACDAAETCSGAALDCPADARATAGTVCRASAGICDAAETCDGVSAACPADAKLAAGTSCRAAAGPCDVAEACNGVGDACPADVFLSAATVCRASGGVCDQAESCTGSSAACPADAKLAAGTLCRASAGVCDVAETCTGASNACPADGFLSSATVCRAAVAGGCDVAETCTGSAAGCPADGVATAGTVCRASTGACDPQEVCTGASNACPADSLSVAGTVCRASAGACDPAEACTGASAACPADTLSASGTVCRGAGGVCDVAESCTGASVACPADGKVAGGTTCRASAGTCDVVEACDGSNNACPANGFTAAGTKVGACVTGLLGVCSAGNNTCSGASASPSCVQTTASSGEVCDGLDNNCNGSADDGVSCGSTTGTDTSWKQTQNPAVGWQNTVFDDSTWAASVDEGAVPIAPWGAIAMPSWSTARWIWSYDSKAANDTQTVYFRKSFVPSISTATLRITADNSFNVYVNGALVGSGNNYPTVYTFSIALNVGATNVIAVQVVNGGGAGGLIADIADPAATTSLVSDTSWKQIQNAPGGWQALGFVDSSWLAAVDETAPPTAPWGGMALPAGSTARWIWSYDSRGSGDVQTVYFRKRFTATKGSYTLYVTADNSFTAYVNGNVVGSGSNWPTVYSFPVTTTAGTAYMLAISAVNAGGPGGLLVDLR